MARADQAQATKPAGGDGFGRSELGRLVLDALRDAPGPQGSMAIARAVMERKGMVASDAGALRRREGRTVDRVASGRALEWRLSTLEPCAA